MERKSKIRILHTGDVHLDSPFSRLGSEKGAIRRRELRGVFTSMMLYAKTQKADIVLISGDLFDVGFAGEETVSLIIKEFAKAPVCKFVISAENHDPYTPKSVYKLKKFPDNVYIFDSQELSRFSFDDLGVDVYGWSFVSERLCQNPLKDKVCEQNGNIPLLCAHCDITSASSVYAPVNIADIERFGAVYSALGHIHRHEGIQRFSNGYMYGYCGCPEGRSFDEPGEGGAYIADIERSVLGTYSVNASFVRFSKRTYQTEQLDLTGVMFTHEAEDRIRELIKEKKYGEYTSLRLILCGRTGVGCLGMETLCADMFGLFSLEITDNTSPTYDCSVFESDMTLRGAFYRVLKPKLESEDEEERKLAAEALRVGFAALDGSDITR